MTTQSMFPWLGQSQTYAGPSAARYGTPSLLDVGGTFYTLTSSASTDPTLKDITFNNQTINFFGVQAPGPTSISQTINATSPRVDATKLEFSASKKGSQISYVWDTQNDDGTLTYHTETYDASSGTLSPGPTIAGVAPVPSTDGPNVGFLIPNSNSSLFIVTAEHLDPTFPSLNAFSTRYEILGPSGNVLVSASGPNYTSGTQYAFTAGAWNPSQFVEFVAIFQGEVKPFFIDATTGNEVSANWNVMTNLSKITSLSYTGLATSPKIILLAGGTASDGSGAASQSLVDASSGETAGTVLKQSILHYSGTVVQNARLSSLGNDDFLFYWVDQSGLHLQEEDSNFNVLENFDIAETNGAATASSYGDGRILVVYNVASPDKSASTQKYTILDTRIAAINGAGVAVNGNVAGTAFDDTIVHSTAATMIDGAGGTDTYAMTQFSSSQISITRNPSGYPAGSISVASPDGTDVLSNVEFLQLADTRILLVPPPSNDPLFDSAYYESAYPDVAAAGVDPLAHYNQYGWHEGRNPDALFNTNAYELTNPDVVAAGVNPLQHYEQFGWKEGRDPSASFSSSLYLLQNPDVKAAGVDPLQHYLQYGKAEGRADPAAVGHGGEIGDFDPHFYLLANPDVAAAVPKGTDPASFAFQHYESYGWKEGRDPNAFFSTTGYLNAYADVKAAGANPLDHYETYGWMEGRDPSPQFDTHQYLSHYTDVAAAHVDPLQHYLSYGAWENRLTFGDGKFG